MMLGAGPSAPVAAVTYATWNPSDKHAEITLSGGNLVATGSTTPTNSAVRANIGKSSGKWYWEVRVNTLGTGVAPGIGSSTQNLNAAGAFNNLEGLRVYYSGNGNIYLPNTGFGATFGAGDVVGCALDMDTGDFKVYKNGSLQGTVVTGLSGTIYPYSIVISEAVPAQVTANFGASAFAHSVPSGYNSGLYS